MWSIARFETKAFWSFAQWWKILFRDFVPLKKWILKKLVGELETTVRLQKNNVFSPALFRIFAKILRIDLPVLFFSSSAHTKKTFQQQSTWTRDRHWTFSHLAGQSNQLAIDHQRRWRQSDDVGNYDELLEIFWRKQLHRHAVNSSKLWKMPSTDFTVKLFVCVKLNLRGPVSQSGTSLNVLHIWIGWNKSWWKIYRSTVVTNASFKPSCVLFTQMILDKTKKIQVPLRTHAKG